MIAPALIGPALLAACIAAEIGLELCFKLAAHPVVTYSRGGRWGALALTMPMWAGIALWALEMLMWIATLQHISLGLAYPLMALTFAGVPLAGRLLLRERLLPVQWAGILLVVAGVACVGATGL